MLKDQVPAELLVEQGLHKVDPHFFDRDDCLLAPRVEPNDQIHDSLEELWTILQSDDGLVVLAHLSPYALAQLCLDLLILAEVVHVLGTVLEEFIRVPTFREHTVDKEVVI